MFHFVNRFFEAESLQSSNSRRVPSRLPHQQGVGSAARRSCRPNEARQVFPALHREGLQERDAGKHLSGNPQVESRFRRAAVEEARHRRSRSLRLHGSAGAGNADESSRVRFDICNSFT